MIRLAATAGFAQVKTYNDLKPAWINTFIDEAHRNGLRASGHIPIGVTVAEAVRAGLDEIHHARFLLHELADDSARVLDQTALFHRVAAADLRGRHAQDLLALLRDHGVTLDATLFAGEESWLWRPGIIPSSRAPIFDRLPLVERRRLLSEIPFLATETWNASGEGNYETARRAFANLLTFVGMLAEAGVTVLPGTDDGSAFALLRELELHVQAGLPAARVLQAATFESARNMGLDDQVGTIEPGRLADLVLVNGDPTREIRDIRRTRLVIKDGAIIDIARLCHELGMIACDSR